MDEQRKYIDVILEQKLSDLRPFRWVGRSTNILIEPHEDTNKYYCTCRMGRIESSYTNVIKNYYIYDLIFCRLFQK